jgi:hypothetical protein
MLVQYDSSDGSGDEAKLKDGKVEKPKRKKKGKKGKAKITADGEEPDSPGLASSLPSMEDIMKGTSTLSFVCSGYYSAGVLRL